MEKFIYDFKKFLPAKIPPATAETGLYTLNSDNYRTKEFDQINWSESVVLFGCSQTFGFAVPDNETISFHLEAILGRPVINMGESGSSIYHALYNQLVLQELELVPKAVVNLWTSTNRLALFNQMGTKNLGPWMPTNDDLSKLFLNWNTNIENPSTYTKMAQRTCRHLWKNTVYYEGTFFPRVAEVLGVKLFAQIDTGYDGEHPGPNTTRMTAKQLAYYIQDKL